MANKVKAKLALQLREAGVSANKVYAAHRISKKSQKEVLDEWLLDKPDDDFRGMIMELMELRCDGRSTIFCTQYQKKDWHAMIAAASTPTRSWTGSCTMPFGSSQGR